MTKQTDEWSGEFGSDYTDRNMQTVDALEDMYKRRFGATCLDMAKEFFGSLPKDIRILEVGCNIGNQLRILQIAGFKSLYGIDIQKYAVELSKQTSKGLNIIVGSAFDIPFKSNYFDMAFTSGVLIHISPDDLPKAMDEIYRCSKEYIWGFEYFSEETKEVPYREKESLLWKADFAKLYMERFPGLKMVKRKKYKYLDGSGDLYDEMFLLKKEK